MMDFIADEWFIVKDELWWKLKMNEKRRRTRLRCRRISERIRWQINHIVPVFYKVLHMASSSPRSLTVDLTSRTNHTISHAHGNFVLPVLPSLTSYTIRDNPIFKPMAHNSFLILASALSSIIYLDLVDLRNEYGWLEIVMNVVGEVGPSLRYLRVNMDGRQRHRTGERNLDNDGILRVKLSGWLRRMFLQVFVRPSAFQHSAFECWKLLAAADYRFMILFPTDEETSLEDLVTPLNHEIEVLQLIVQFANILILLHLYASPTPFPKGS